MARSNRHLRHVSNPPNPWQGTLVEWLEEPPQTALEVFEDRSRTILSENDSPDVPFGYSVNAYRGCYHGCAYCYARPTHEYLDFGAGTDFERKLVVKPEAATLLRRRLDSPSWTGSLIAFSGNTDPYQPLEASYALTRSCLEVCLEFRNPVWIITKAPLVERDLDVLSGLARDAFASVSISIPAWDADKSRAVEPWVSSPARRMRTVARLAEANIPVVVNVCPIIPGLTDDDIPPLLTAAREAGAHWATMSLIRLPGPVRAVFEERIRAALPLRADRILHQIEDCRGGRLYDARFGHRMRGTGERWSAIESLFSTMRRRLGFPGRPQVPDPSPFRRPDRGSQLELL